MPRTRRAKSISTSRTQRWTAHEWAQVQTQARRVGMTPSDYIRELVFTHGAVQRRARARLQALQAKRTTKPAKPKRKRASTPASAPASDNAPAEALERVQNAMEALSVARSSARKHGFEA